MPSQALSESGSTNTEISPQLISIYSWTVNGLRSVLRKGALQDFIAAYHPDILCIQETKAKPGQAEVDFPEYEELWNSAERPGYSGTAIFTKIKPIMVRNGLPSAYLSSAECTDAYGDPLSEGRILTAEFPDFYLVNVYTPNSKRALERLNLRATLWDPAILRYLKSLEESKPVVICGDFNAAHTEMDLARPKDNHRNAGFTDEERQGVTNLIGAGFTDTFRFLHPEEIRYTWWSNIGHARINNVGWRIDYFFISDSLNSHLKSAEIYDDIMWSDHCPISIELEF